jgi:capsular exopolysaccharide synthesis family protein
MRSTPAPLSLRQSNGSGPTLLAWSPGEDAAIGRQNLVQAWRTVRKYWASSLATTLATLLATVFYTFGQTKTYEATATLLLDPNPPRPLGKQVDNVVELGAGRLDNREYFETQYRIIQSMRVALGVVQELGLDHDPSFLRNAPHGANLAPKTVPSDEAAALLLRRLTVEPVKESRLANVRYDDADPARAQRILTTIVAVYLQQNLDTAVDSTGAAVDWLHTQLDRLKVNLESSEMALHDYKLQKNILSVNFDDQTNMLREEMKLIDDAMTNARTKRAELDARRAELSTIQGDDPTDLRARELMQSPEIQALRQRYSEAVRDRDGVLASGKGANHPDAKTAEARVGATKASLLEEIRNIRGAVDRDLAGVEREYASLSDLFERSKKQAFELNLLEIEYNRLRRSKENTEKLYALVLERTTETDLTRMMRVNNISIVDRPLLPREPVRPRIPVNLAFGLLIGLTLGAASALLRALMDRTIKTPDDVETELGLTFLGLLPQIRSGAEGREPKRRLRRRPVREVGTPDLVVHERPRSGIAEAARAVRTNLLFMAPDKPLRTLLITSAAPSEGKTTVACCIAIAMAQTGQRVALVDCDLRRPRVHRIFSKSSRSGVTTALLDEPLPDEALETVVPNLSVIPSGPLPPSATELFHSERFRRFLRELEQRFDRVIIDSPPINAVTDAVVLSTFVDGTLLVVRGYETTKEAALHGLRTLREVGSKTLGVVLNGIDLDQHEYKHYHAYYRHEYYAKEGAAPADAGSGIPATH